MKTPLPFASPWLGPLRIALVSFLSLALAGAAEIATPRAEKPAAAEEAVQMTPFEVSSAGDRGYYGANTMSGTRINSKLEDLANSITVVTKEQMADFALLDLNDIFNYEAGTEGTG